MHFGLSLMKIHWLGWSFTKSANITALKSFEPLPNVVVSFSLSPERALKMYDRSTPSLKARLGAIKYYNDRGFKIGLHLDPIIFEEQFEANYTKLIIDILNHVNEDQIEYLSVGVVRFSKDVYREVKQNYPESDLWVGEFVKSFDGKVRYQRPHRLYMLKKVKEICVSKGIKASKVYLCMEED